jgi:uncharacterized membrane protein YdjX (TVP38/TMEM64 family)
VKIERKKLYAFANIAALAALCIWIYFNYQSQGIFYNFFTGDSDGFLAAFSAMDQGTKIMAVIVAIIIEVIIGFIPGPVVYPFVGILVGPFLGSVLIIIGNIIGSVINYFQGRLIWNGLNDVNENTPRYFKKFHEEGSRALFMLRLNPMTSFDFLPYIAGGAGMKFWPFFWANTLGLLPVIILGTYFGSEIAEKYTWTLYLLLAATIIYIIYSAYKNRRLRKSYD